MFLFSQRQTLYIIAACLISLLILGLFFAPFIYKASLRKKYKKSYYKKINKLVIDKDYLLINNFIIKNLDIKIDHIVFAHKYIYIIKDSYYDGAIEGKIKDNKWVYYPYKNRDVLTVDNPYINLHQNLETLIQLVGLNKGLFYMISIINDDVFVNIENHKVKNYSIATRSTLISTIEDIENAADLKDINQDELLAAAKGIARINERNNKYHG